MKCKIDEGVEVLTEQIELIQWFTAPAEGGGFIPYVRIERSGGRHEIHVKAGTAVADLAEAERLAIARAEKIIAAAMAEAVPAETT